MKFSLRYITESKDGNPDHNEDCFGFFGNTYWLLDGATSPKGMKTSGGLTAKWYVRGLSRGIIQALIQDNETSLRDVLKYAIQGLSNAISRGQVDDGEFYSPSATAILVRLHEDYLEYLLLGDSYLLLNTKTSATCITDDRIKSVGTTYRTEALKLLRSGVGYEDRRFLQLKLQLVESEHANRNKEGGYWIASDDVLAVEHALTGSVPYSELNGNLEVILMTDGFARALTTYNMYKNWMEFLHIIRDKGLDHVLRLIREIEASDSNGVKFPRMSRSDDATAVYLCGEKG